MTDVDLTISAGQQQPSGVRLALTLTFAGFIAGIVLAGAHQVTRPMIEANQAERLRLAIFKVVDGSSRMQKLVLRDGALVTLPADEQTGEPVLYAAYDDSGSFMGYAIEGEGAGFQDRIRVLFGIDPAARRVIGMEILESRETPGLGDKIYKDLVFVDQFGDLAFEPSIEVVKDGADAEHEVDAITGATISSKAVVSIINEANARWLASLPPPGEEPPLTDRAGGGSAPAEGGDQ